MQTLPNLPAAIVRETFAALCALLPPRPDDTPEARADREETALALLAALQPADVVQADLSVRIVGAGLHASDSLRAAAQPDQPAEEARRHRAQATSMMRAAERMRHALERRQAACQATPATTQPEAHAPAEAPKTEPAGKSRRDAPARAPVAPPPFPLAKAEAYASANPEHATRIRAVGGLPPPPRLDFDPPPPDIVATLVNGKSTILHALDHIAQRDTASRDAVQRDVHETHVEIALA